MHKIYFLENSDGSLDISKEISYIMFVSTGKLQILHNYFFAAFKSDLCGSVYNKMHALASNVRVKLRFLLFICMILYVVLHFAARTASCITSFFEAREIER